jgi:hypothetical protein
VGKAFVGGHEIYRFDHDQGLGHFGDLVWVP